MYPVGGLWILAAPCLLDTRNGRSPERHLVRDGSCDTSLLDDTYAVDVEETLPDKLDSDSISNLPGEHVVGGDDLREVRV